MNDEMIRILYILVRHYYTSFNDGNIPIYLQIKY